MSADISLKKAFFGPIVPITRTHNTDTVEKGLFRCYCTHNTDTVEKNTDYR